MSKKAPALDLDDPEKRQGSLVVRYTFEDGSEDGIIGLTQAIGLNVKAARTSGEFFGKKARADQSRDAAAKSRRRDPLRQHIVDVMQPYKRAGATLKAFLDVWQHEPIEGLRLALARGVFTVTDEESIAGSHKRYALGTLTKLWSEPID